MEEKVSAPERDYYFDNLKALLIFLVVLGHFLLPIEPKDSEYIAAIKRLIYVFHMPLFIFVTGYFSKHIYKKGRYNWEKIFYFVKCYLIYVVLNQIVATLIGEESFAKIDFLEQSGAPWYLFATVVWYLTIPIVKRLHPALVIIISLSLALLAGYQDQIGDFLCLSRIIVFSVFFYMGYFMNETHVRWILRKRNMIFVFPLAIMAGYQAIHLSMTHKRSMLIVYQNLPYSEVGKDIPGLYLRIFAMVAAVFVSWAIMFLVSKKKMIFSVIGQRTLTIYILHRPLRTICEHYGFYELLSSMHQPILMFFILFMISVALTILFAGKHINDGLNQLLKLHTIGKQQARAFGNLVAQRRVLWHHLHQAR